MIRKQPAPTPWSPLEGMSAELQQYYSETVGAASPKPEEGVFSILPPVNLGKLVLDIHSEGNLARNDETGLLLLFGMVNPDTEGAIRARTIMELKHNAAERTMGLIRTYAARGTKHGAPFPDEQRFRLGASYFQRLRAGLRIAEVRRETLPRIIQKERLVFRALTLDPKLASPMVSAHIGYTLWTVTAPVTEV